MTTQLALPLAPLVAPEYAEHLTIAQRFAAFHAANPHVADALELLAEQWLARHQRVGMKALIERLRWESGITTAGDAYRLNNTYTAHYARLLIERRPEWSDAIHLRELRAA
jgi:predicted DsbA family dithiol-disulfide isomerase